MLGEEDGFEEHAAAEGFFEQVFAFDRDEAAAETGLSGEGAAKLLDARVGRLAITFGAVGIAGDFTLRPRSDDRRGGMTARVTGCGGWIRAGVC